MDVDSTQIYAEKKWRHVFPYKGAVLAIALVIIAVFLTRPPFSFRKGVIVNISKGVTLSRAAEVFKEAGVIRSTQLLKVFVRLLAHDGAVKAGDYEFETPPTIIEVARRVTKGIYGLSLVRVTIPEGNSNRGVAERLSESLPGFNQEGFLQKAKNLEGYLFPDTYFFLPNATPDTVIRQMKENFDKKILTVEKDLTLSSHTLKEVVIMASLVEKEVADAEARKMVAGILWKRAKLGMPLQVDASFVYLFGKQSSELTLTDLATDSPYNTYKYAGLPPGPIGNPGLDAIAAVLHPTPSPYFYYLTDSSGVTHYARTFEEHKLNKERYLR